MLRALSVLLKTLLPILLLVAGAWYAKYLMDSTPEPPKRPPPDRTPVVEVKPLQAQDYTIHLNASGIVKARLQTNLVSQVAGKIIDLSPNFKAGGYFAADEVLMTLDDNDQRDTIRITESNMAAQQASLAQLNQEEQNTRSAWNLAQNNLKSVQENLRLAQQNLGNVKRNAPVINKNVALIKDNMNLAKQNTALTRKNLDLAKRNHAIAKQEQARLQTLWNQRLIPRNEIDASAQKVLQLEQQIVQQEQTLVQQQQSQVQYQQQLSQQDQSTVQLDQNTLQQQQQIVQQQQAVNQQIQSIENLKGQLATYPDRRASILANLEASKAQLAQHKRNLGRSQIKAPYAGRILEQRVDIGQYVSANSVLGIIYAIDYVEVDIPLSLNQFELLDLPKGQESDSAYALLPPVELRVPLSSSKQSWQGQITGTRASLNEQSRQITLVVRVDHPYDQRSDNFDSLKIGQYLNAKLTGRTLHDVYIIPPAALRQNKEILLMRENAIHIVPVETVWNAEQDIVVKSSEPLMNENLIITPLPQGSEGMKVALVGAKKRNRGNGGNGGKPNPSGAEANSEQPNGEQESSKRGKRQDSAAPNTEANSNQQNTNQENGNRTRKRDGAAPNIEANSDQQSTNQENGNRARRRDSAAPNTEANPASQNSNRKAADNGGKKDAKPNNNDQNTSNRGKNKEDANPSYLKPDTSATPTPAQGE